MTRFYSFSYLLYYFLLLIQQQQIVVHSKKTSGDFKLSGINSDYVLSNFAISNSASIQIIMNTGQIVYPGTVTLRAYSDIVWKQYNKATTCESKIKYAHQSILVDFQYQTIAIKNIKIWRSSNTFYINAIPANAYPNHNRTYYWYFVIDDCSLEQYYMDNKVPIIHYDISLLNYLNNEHTGINTHFSADQFHLKFYHIITMILSSTVLCRLLYTIIYQIFFTRNSNGGSSNSGGSSIHIAVLWITIGAIFDMLSSFFELLHLQSYSNNGIGIYCIDAIAAHCEAICDTLIILFLLSIGSGWTLPSSTLIMKNTSNTTNAFYSLINGLSKPISSLISISNITSIFGWIVLLIHIILTQWGRTYNDEYDSYHDYEHLPGKLLMSIRIILGIIYWIITYQTRLSCGNTNIKLIQFYYHIGIIGFIWFISLPIFIYYCSSTWFISHYNKLPMVCIGSSLLQSISLLSLSWLVTGHSSIYHQYSHITHTESVSLTDLLSSSSNNNMNDSDKNSNSSSNNNSSKGLSSWSVGKTKVRLD